MFGKSLKVRGQYMFVSYLLVFFLVGVVGFFVVQYIHDLLLPMIKELLPFLGLSVFSAKLLLENGGNIVLVSHCDDVNDFLARANNTLDSIGERRPGWTHDEIENCKLELSYRVTTKADLSFDVAITSSGSLADTGYIRYELESMINAIVIPATLLG